MAANWISFVSLRLVSAREEEEEGEEEEEEEEEEEKKLWPSREKAFAPCNGGAVPFEFAVLS